MTWGEEILHCRKGMKSEDGYLKGVSKSWREAEVGGGRKGSKRVRKWGGA